MAQNPPNNGAVPAPVPEVINLANVPEPNPLELAVLHNLMDIGSALSDAHKTEQEKEEIAASIEAFYHALMAGEADAQLDFQAPNVGPNLNDGVLDQLKANMRAVVDTQNAQLIQNVENTIYIIMMIGDFEDNELNAVVPNNAAAAAGAGAPGQQGGRRKRKTRRGRRSIQRRRRNTRRRRISRRK